MGNESNIIGPGALPRGKGIPGNLGYSQGGVIIDGVAFFTANRVTYDIFDYPTDPTNWDNVASYYKNSDYEYVAAFDAQSLELLAKYPFEDTYDSTPLVIQNIDGRWLIIAHEYLKERSKALDLFTGEVVWISEGNQPGLYFFGYSYYRRKDGRILVLTEADNGLHAMDLSTGKDVWWVSRAGGVTPAVDQENALIYFQSNNYVDKIDAETGKVLVTRQVKPSHYVYSGNTVLIKDNHGHFIATFWFLPNCGSSILILDSDLDTVWERGGMNQWYKITLTYHDGLLFVGGGGYADYNNLCDSSWKTVTSYKIKTGDINWILDLSEFDYEGIANIIYANGYLIVEEQGMHYQIWIIDANSGQLIQYYGIEDPGTSCAPPVLSGGRLYSGNLMGDFVQVTQLGEGDMNDWPGAFGDLQTNTMSASDSSLEILYSDFLIVSFADSQ